MAAANPAEPELLVEVQALRTTVLGMESSVANLIHNVGQFTTDMRGLLASADQGVYGESYATDSGPAIRARFFERLTRETEEQAMRLSEFNDNMLNHDGAITELTDIITARTANFEGELRNLRNEVGVSRSSVPADRNNKNTTGTKGFE